MTRKIKVTLFVAILEQKLERVIKDIKKRRKNADIADTKVRIEEARELREIVRSANERKEEQWT